MHPNRKFSLGLFLLVALFACAQASRATGAVNTIQNPGGGTIYYGSLSGQLTPQQALGQVLQQVDTMYGNRPQLGKVVQNQAGTVWEGFFTVNDKSGAAMTGMVIVYAPKTGTAGGAVLIDTSARFAQTANSMFQRLVQAVTGSSQPAQAPVQAASSASQATPAAAGAPASPQPAQKLTPYIFPDHSGSMGLPPGWTVVRAQMGDVTAKGANGEQLRFGLVIPVIDPTNPQSRALMGRGTAAPGNFVAVPYNADPATLFTQAGAQIAQKMRAQAPTVTVQNTQNLPIQGGKDFMIYGEVDSHDGNGAQAMVAQVVVSPPQVAGAYQMTVFEITAPPQVMVNESATISEIFPNYSKNAQYVNAVANAQIQQGLMQEKQFIGTVGSYINSSNQMTAGMSNLLRGQTVIEDTQTGAHATTSDQLADWLTQNNPNRFQAVPESDYINGIDY
jgi:hypothetical protein